MLRRIALVPVLAAAFALAACQPKAPEAAGNAVDVAAANGAVVANASAPATNASAPAANAAAASNTASKSSAAPAGGYADGSAAAVCGGIVGKQCTMPGQFCKLPQGQCKVSDAQGSCTPRPKICGKIFKPVCGCNGKTYGNECQASAAGVSVQSQGECPKK
jgi:hypothetical protein